MQRPDAFLQAVAPPTALDPYIADPNAITVIPLLMVLVLRLALLLVAHGYKNARTISLVITVRTVKHKTANRRSVSFQMRSYRTQHDIFYPT